MLRDPYGAHALRPSSAHHQRLRLLIESASPRGSRKTRPSIAAGFSDNFGERPQLNVLEECRALEEALYALTGPVRRNTNSLKRCPQAETCCAFPRGPTSPPIASLVTRPLSQ